MAWQAMRRRNFVGELAAHRRCRQQRRAPGRQRHPGWRKRLGVLPLQRLLFSRRTVRGTGETSGHRTARPSPNCSDKNANAAPLPALVAGSWVYGNLATWIGSPDKNRAWDLLCAAKRSFDLVMASGIASARPKPRPRRASSPIARPPTGSGGSATTTRRIGGRFDRLFRRKLSHLYSLLHLPAPAELATPVSLGKQVSGTHHRDAPGILTATLPLTYPNLPDMTRKVSLLFGVHAHQPAGNFPEVIDDAHLRCYQPFLDTFTATRISFRRAFQRLAARLSAAAISRTIWLSCARWWQRGQVEMFGGGDTEPVLAAIPERDRRSQLDGLVRAARAAASAQRPSGAWLTERVWESAVAPALGRLRHPLRHGGRLPFSLRGQSTPRS